MPILKSYHKIKRIDAGIKAIRGKHYLGLKATRQLLGTGDKIVQEKLDGRPVSILLNKAQVFYEHLKVRHTIPYTQLPSWNIAFDVWDTLRSKFTGTEGLSILHRRFRWELAPLLHRKFEPLKIDELLPFLEMKSQYNPDHKIEGIVVKNYTTGIMGKLVNPEFEDAVDAGVHPEKRRIREFNVLRVDLATPSV